MNPRRLKRHALTGTTVVAIAGLVQAGPVSAENGKGKEAGHGELPGETVLLDKRGKSGTVEHGDEASGAVASSLRHLKRPMPAKSRCYAPTSAASRDRRDTGLAEVIQAGTVALYPVADADRITLPQQEKAGTRTDAEAGGGMISGRVPDMQISVWWSESRHNELVQRFAVELDPVFRGTTD